VTGCSPPSEPVDDMADDTAEMTIGTAVGPAVDPAVDQQSKPTRPFDNCAHRGMLKTGIEANA